ncbi:MAG: VanW family protein [Eubacteriales bacterium]|nr:VanW family protein [Eubacteriales bacterium]
MPKRASRNRLMNILFLVLGVLIVALIVVLILMLANGGATDADAEAEQLKQSARYVQGVSVGGVDISGMSYAAASKNEDIQRLAQDAVTGFTYTFTINGEEYSYTAEQLGITSNLEVVLLEALAYGNEGDGAKIREQKATAQESGVDFALAPYADEMAVLEKLASYEPEYNAEGQDAAVIIGEIVGKEGVTSLEELEGVTFTEGVAGIDVDIAALAELISTNINNKDYSVIEAPAEISDNIDIETLRENTQLIVSFPTSYEGSSDNRSTNVEILADIISGVVLEPGVVWSINEEAGPRNAQTAATVGWKEEKGIVNGRYEMEYGGGVCQISTTLYNAALRAELTIEERSSHSWPSSYVDEGLDATISTGGKDLKLLNPYNMPVYIVAYTDKEEKIVTVDIYGPPLAHGYTVDFSSTLKETIPPPETVYHYDATTLPNGDPIEEGKQVTWVQSRIGQVWYVYKKYLDAEGNVVDSWLYYTESYSCYQGQIYVNGPDPALPTPTPTA